MRVLIASIAICAGVAVASAAPPGRHVRLRTPRGPLHLWTPAGHDPATADLVIYVHGYFVTIDEAWREHRLAEQFARTGLNATFVVCGAPSAHGDAVDWPALDELIANTPGAGGGRVIVI